MSTNEAHNQPGTISEPDLDAMLHRASVADILVVEAYLRGVVEAVQRATYYGPNADIFGPREPQDFTALDVMRLRAIAPEAERQLARVQTALYRALIETGARAR